MKKNVLLVMAAASIFIAASCQFNLSKNTNTVISGNNSNKNSSGVPFDNFTPYSIRVKNDTGENLIAFKGKISKATLISGVPANASNHGLKPNNTLFSATGDFALLFLTEEVYIQNKNNLDSLNKNPFASLYAFYNKSGDNNTVYTINSKMGGQEKLLIQNGSKFNVELRLDSPQGEVLGYAAAESINTILRLATGDYYIYPVFKKYYKDEVHSIFPKNSDGKPYYRLITLNGREREFNVTDLYNPKDFTFSSGGCYITIDNQAKTDVNFLQGGTRFETSTGIYGIPEGEAITFFIPFTSDNNKNYPKTRKISSLKVGLGYDGVEVPSHEYKIDTKYRITVEGKDTPSLKLSEKGIEELGQISVEEIFENK